MIKRKPWTGGTDEEYETQHFGFGSQTFQNSLQRMVKEKIINVVKNMELSLHKSLDLNDTDKATLTHSCDKLIRLYLERTGPSLELIDNAMKQMLHVPSNVLLPDDDPQLDQISDADYEKLQKEVDALQVRVKRGALMEALLTAEEEELSAVDKVCQEAKKDMARFDSIVHGCKTDVVTVLEKCGNAKLVVCDVFNNK